MVKLVNPAGALNGKMVKAVGAMMRPIYKAAEPGRGENGKIAKQEGRKSELVNGTGDMVR